MSKTQLRVAKTSEKEIDSLFAILNEAEALKKELEHNFLEDIDFSEFEIMKSFNRENEEGFLTDFVRHLSGIHFQRILFNCQTLLDNCADPDSETLDFNKDIKRGLELLEAQGNTTTATAGEKIEAGDFVYISEDGKALESDRTKIDNH